MKNVAPDILKAHCDAMVIACQGALEANGECAHMVSLLGEDGKVRFTALLLYSDAGGRDQVQALKHETWLALGRLFNLFDAAAMLFCQDSWMTTIDKEEFERGDWGWPKDDPLRAEALMLTIYTDHSFATMMGPYTRTEDGIEWGTWESARTSAGTQEEIILGQLIKENAHLRPGKYGVGVRLQPPQKIIARLRELGHYVVEVDERYLRTN